MKINHPLSPLKTKSADGNFICVHLRHLWFIPFFCMVCGICGLTLKQVAAQQPVDQEFVPSEAQAKILKDIETYLNGFKTFSADFKQESTRGDMLKGRLYIQRPGKMRFQYDEPAPFQLLANGSHIVFFEPKRDQVTYIPTDKTPAALILRNDVSFKDPAIRVLDVMRQKDSLFVMIVQRKDPAGGNLTLQFSASPVKLTGWEIIDAGGVMTRITLTNPVYDKKLDRKLFVFDDPREKKMPGDL